MLVSDDDQATAEVITRVRADDGYAVEVATSAPDARRLLAAHSHDGFRRVMCDALSSPCADSVVWLGHVRTLTAPEVIAAGYPATGWTERGLAAVRAQPLDLSDLSAQER